MDVRPLHDRIIVRRLAEGEQQSGGIIDTRVDPNGAIQDIFLSRPPADPWIRRCPRAAVQSGTGGPVQQEIRW